MQIDVVIAKVFSDAPGGRFKKDGPKSGEEFRESILEPNFRKLSNADILLIDFDGAFGYPISFLEEAFGGLARIHGPDEVLRKLRFKSSEEPSLIPSVERYIREAKK